MSKKKRERERDYLLIGKVDTSAWSADLPCVSTRSAVCTETKMASHSAETLWKALAIYWVFLLLQILNSVFA